MRHFGLRQKSLTKASVTDLFQLSNPGNNTAKGISIYTFRKDFVVYMCSQAEDCGNSIFTLTHVNYISNA